jgi:hypothetical protein
MPARLFVPVIALMVTASVPAWFSARRNSQACDGPPAIALAAGRPSSEESLMRLGAMGTAQIHRA